MGSVAWRDNIEEEQGLSPDSYIPSLNKPSGSATTSWTGKTQLLASNCSSKIPSPDPGRPPPTLPLLTNARPSTTIITRRDVEKLFLHDGGDSRPLAPDRKPSYSSGMFTTTKILSCTLHPNFHWTTRMATILAAGTSAAVHKKSKLPVDIFRTLSLLSHPRDILKYSFAKGSA